jgi:hypothetical protein
MQVGVLRAASADKPAGPSLHRSGEACLVVQVNERPRSWRSIALGTSSSARSAVMCSRFVF